MNEKEAHGLPQYLLIVKFLSATDEEAGSFEDKVARRTSPNLIFKVGLVF